MTCGGRWQSNLTVNADGSIGIVPLGNDVIPSTTLSINGSELSIVVNGSRNTFTLPNDPNTTSNLFETTTGDGTLTKFNGAKAAATAFDADGITASLGFLNDGSIGIGLLSNGSTLQTGQWENILSTTTITNLLQQASQIKSAYGSPAPSAGSGSLISNASIIQNALNKLANPDGGFTPPPCRGLHCPPPPLVVTAATQTCYDLIRTTIDNQTGQVLAQVDLGTLFCAMDNFPTYGFSGNTHTWGGGVGIGLATPTPSAYDKFKCIADAILASYGVAAFKGLSKAILKLAKGNPTFWSGELEGGAAFGALLLDILWPVLAGVIIGLSIWAIFDAIKTCQDSGVI